MGFDIDFGANILYYAVTRFDSPPQIGAYNLATQAFSKMPIDFTNTEGKNRECLWLRLSPDRKQLVYSNFSRNALYGLDMEGGRIGIVTIESLQKEELNTREILDNTEFHLALFPNWSPDSRFILYSNTPGIPTGRLSYARCYLYEIGD